MKIAFTGALDKTRNEVEDIIRHHGHKFHKKVSGKTDLLVVGGTKEHHDKTSKHRDAVMKGVKIVYVETFDELVRMFIAHFM